MKSKRFWILIGLPAIFVIALAGMWFTGRSSLNSQLAALRADGLPTTASELNDFYVVPEGVTDTSELWVAAIDAVQGANLPVRGKTLPVVGEGPTPVPPPGEAWAELDAARTLLAEMDEEFQAIRRAATAGGQARFPVNFSAGIATLLPHMQDARQVARLLVLDAHVSAHDGNDSQALDDLKAIFALSDALRGEPCLVSQLVRIAIHAIGCDAVERLMPHCQWSDAELESLQSSIRSARFKEELANAMHGERATCLTELDRMPLGPLRQSNKREVLRIFKSSIDAYSGSWQDAISRQTELSAEIMSLAGGRISRMKFMSALMLLPAVEQLTIAGARADARQKCTIAGLAAQRFRLQHGRLPKSLTEIGKKFLGGSSEPSAQLTDPFDGKPLRFKIVGDRLLIYSVGENGQDDGGSFGDDIEGQPLDFGFSLNK